tara:strand:- start:3707 stop:4360 length:654 start_codon:yes stop_codon:yes gene_type:complete
MKELSITTEFFNPFASPEISPACNEHWAAKRELADAIKALNEALMTSNGSVETLLTAAKTIREQSTEISKEPRLFGVMAFIGTGEHGTYAEIANEMNALGGHSNPMAPGINMWVDGMCAAGTVSFNHSYEGPPGFVHGGYVAGILDQFLGMAQIVGKQPGMTGTLTIHYHQPTPLDTELQLRAESKTVGERKTRVTGTISVGDQITATAEGLFIRPK